MCISTKGWEKKMGRKPKEPVRYERLVADPEAAEQSQGTAPPRGYVPVLVGREEDEGRFFLHTNLLGHPAVVALLEMAAEEFGYQQQGVLRLPCCIEHFRRVVRSSGLQGHVMLKLDSA